MGDKLVCRWDLDDIMSDNIINHPFNIDDGIIDKMIDDYVSDKSHTITDYDDILSSIKDTLDISFPVKYSNKKPSDFMQMFEKTATGYKPLNEFISLENGNIYTEQEYLQLLGTITFEYHFDTGEDIQRGTFDYQPSFNWHKLNMDIIPFDKYIDCDGNIPPTIEDIRQEWLEEEYENR